MYKEVSLASLQQNVIKDNIIHLPVTKENPNGKDYDECRHGFMSPILPTRITTHPTFCIPQANWRPSLCFTLRQQKQTPRQTIDCALSARANWGSERPSISYPTNNSRGYSTGILCSKREPLVVCGYFFLSASLNVCAVCLLESRMYQPYRFSLRYFTVEISNSLTFSVRGEFKYIGRIEHSESFYAKCAKMDEFDI